MEAHEASNAISVETLYRLHSDRMLNFIQSRIDSREDAENLAQDIWMKLLESDSPIYEDSALPYLYRIASNIVNDYLRKLYVRIDSKEELERGYAERQTVSPMQEYIANEIAMLESFRVECLPTQRRIIYKMSRFDEMAVADIAESLSLSFRTVENHLRLGRRDVREFISAYA